MKKIAWIILILILMTLFVSACAPQPSPEAVDMKAALAGTSWAMTELGGKRPLSGQSITMQFTEQGISGSGGCNQYGAPVEFDGSKVKINSPTSTLIACEGGSSEQEMDFFQALTSTDRLDLRKGKLFLLDERGKTLATFESLQQP